MPKVGLSLGSSFEKLFHKALNPSKLRLFGCLCFPWLHPFSSHKLDPKYNTCVLLSYSLTQSVFLYFDPILKKNLCVPSCQVCGKCFLIYVSPYLPNAGSRPKLCPPHFIVHLGKLSRTATLTRTIEIIPITPPVLLPTYISPTPSTNLPIPAKIFPITPIVLS